MLDIGLKDRNDLDTAKVMLDTGQYLYVAYMCQQTIEKMLKAIITQHGKENFPIHNLNRLAEITSISNELTSEQFNFLAELTPYHIEARPGLFTYLRTSRTPYCFIRCVARSRRNFILSAQNSKASLADPHLVNRSSNPAIFSS